MNKEIEEGLKNIFNAITAKKDEEVSELLYEAIESIKKSEIELDSPDTFNSFINNELKRVSRLIVEGVCEPFTCIYKDKFNFIYTNYDFLERHIRELCTLKEGPSCCADKSRYILKMFLKYSIDGEIPDFDPRLEKYWIPNFGDDEMWINYCNSLYRLYYGKTDTYFNAYNELLQAEKRKFMHFLHTWYMQLENGDILEIGKTWDDKRECPLKYYDKGDYYAVRRRYIKGNNFESYIPEGEEEFLYGNDFVKVYKSVIKNIYYETEAKMV